MIIKLLTEHHLEFLSLTGGCRGLSESTLVKMSNCWKSHAAAQILLHSVSPDHVHHTLTSNTFAIIPCLSVVGKAALFYGTCTNSADADLT